MYGETTGNMLHRTQKLNFKSSEYFRLRQAMQFGEKLIFDCSYDEYMNDHEAKNAAEQLLHSFSANRKHREPFDLHFCNANFNGTIIKQLKKYIPGMGKKEFPLNIHEGSYLDLFPKKNIVYLTPHCRDDLTDYDPDIIYVIGMMVYRNGQQPLSLAKAKELNLQVARLPLDKYLEPGSGRCKMLKLDQITKIMLDLKETRNWEIALQHVPQKRISKEIDIFKSDNFCEFSNK